MDGSLPLVSGFAGGFIRASKTSGSVDSVGLAVLTDLINLYLVFLSSCAGGC